jgi:hypothetical protein
MCLAIEIIELLERLHNPIRATIQSSGKNAIWNLPSDLAISTQISEPGIFRVPGPAEGVEGWACGFLEIGLVIIIFLSRLATSLAVKAARLAITTQGLLLFSVGDFLRSQNSG